MPMATIHTADLCDELGPAARVCLAPWRSHGGRHAVSGHVQTLRTFEDAALIRHTLGTPGKARVLVIDAGGSLKAAVLGDRMARIGMDNGWAGVLVYGAIHDVAILQGLDFGVFALGSVPARGGKAGTGEVGVDLTIGSASIRPGDFIAMDHDGVVVTAGISTTRHPAG